MLLTFGFVACCDVEKSREMIPQAPSFWILLRVWNFICVLFLIRQKKSSKDSRVKRLNIGLWISGWNHFASHFLTWEILIQSGSHAIGNWEWRWMKSKSILMAGWSSRGPPKEMCETLQKPVGLRSFFGSVYRTTCGGWRNCFPPLRAEEQSPFNAILWRCILLGCPRKLDKWLNIDVFTTYKWRLALTNWRVSVNYGLNTIPFVPSRK